MWCPLNLAETVANECKTNRLQIISTYLTITAVRVASRNTVNVEQIFKTNERMKIDKNIENLQRQFSS